MLVPISTTRLAEVLPELLTFWPLEEGKWTTASLRRLKQVLRPQQRSAGTPTVRLNTSISRARLRHAALTLLGAVTSTPYRFTDYYVGLPSTPMNPGQKGKSKAKGLNAAALKLRPGMDLDISLEGHPTRAVMNSVRRIELRGSKNWIKADLSIEVSKLPLLLERETKCDCRYCGNRPKGAETECSKCGAPLPDC